VVVNRALSTGTVNSPRPTVTPAHGRSRRTLSLNGNGTLASTDIQIDANIGPTRIPTPRPVGLLLLDNTNTLNGNRLPDNATLTFAAAP